MVFDCIKIFNLVLCHFKTKVTENSREKMEPTH